MHSFRPLPLLRIDIPQTTSSEIESDSFQPKLSQLKADSVPSFYIYEMSYLDAEGRAKTLRGIVGKTVVGAEDTTSPPYENTKHLLGHELTLFDQEDFSHDSMTSHGPIWLLAESGDIEELTNSEGPLVSQYRSTNGVHHRMWQILGQGYHDLISSSMEALPLIVADGHHRIRSALSRVENGQPGTTAELITFVTCLSDPSLEVRPIHRAFRLSHEEHLTPSALTDHLTLKEIPAYDQKSSIRLPQLLTPEKRYEITAFSDERGVTWDLSDSKTSDVVADSELVNVLATERVEEVFYRSSADSVIELVESGQAQLAIICRSVSLNRIRSAASSAVPLPPKSTLFFPKPLQAMMWSDASKLHGTITMSE